VVGGGFLLKTNWVSNEVKTTDIKTLKKNLLIRTRNGNEILKTFLTDGFLHPNNNSAKI